MKIMKGTIHQIKNLKEVYAPAYKETKNRYRDMIRKRFGTPSDFGESPEAGFLRNVMGMDKYKKFTDIIGVKPESKTLDEASDWWKKFSERWVILRADYETFEPSQYGEGNRPQDKGREKSYIQPPYFGYENRADAESHNQDIIREGRKLTPRKEPSKEEIDEVIEDLNEVTPDKQLQQLIDEFLDDPTQMGTQTQDSKYQEYHSQFSPEQRDTRPFTQRYKDLDMRLKRLDSAVDLAIQNKNLTQVTLGKFVDYAQKLKNKEIGVDEKGRSHVQAQHRRKLDAIRNKMIQYLVKQDPTSEKKWEGTLLKSPLDDLLDRYIDELDQLETVKKSVFNPLLNKAIIETEFVRDYPQYVTEMKEEMRFRNMDQPEAELKIARKYRLPILSKLKGKQGTGRWTRMLKLAGAVTSTHAGIESKPIYGKKKKKKEEDEE